jgi:methionyl-tRNA synthetase
MTNSFVELLLTQNPLVFFLLIAWSLVWKGIALWRSARNNQKGWFVALLIINTLGILEILYIFVFSKERKEVKVESKGKEKIK